MKGLKRKSNTVVTLCIMLILSFPGLVSAKVSIDEASELGKTLTGVGAEMAGNKDGTIPAYPESIKIPTKFKPESGRYPNPYADERDLFTIDSRNMDEYADKLSDGTKQMLKKYSTFRLNVYPTHRNVVFPAWLVENTKKNAITSSTGNNGLSMENARGGYPFPIPKTGYEAMFNHMCHYQGKAFDNKNKGFNVDRSGRILPGATGTFHVELTYYFENVSDFHKPFIWRSWWEYTGPPRKSGEKLTLSMAMNPVEDKDLVWQYLPGQRRTKAAPELRFDTPNSGTAGVQNLDDYDMYSGSMERYDMKLLGKQEMYIPYNNYNIAFEAKSKELCSMNHLNPEITRWEKHRVWVVEGTLKEGKRHSYPKRRFYLDEDSWVCIISEQYDARDVLSKICWDLMFYCYDDQRVFTYTLVTYDFLSGRYYVNDLMGEGGYVKRSKIYPENFWTAENLAGSGVR